MPTFQIATFVLSVVTLILVPIVIALLKGALRWARVEDKLDRMVDKMELIVEDKDRTHAEIVTQMREDRSVTNQRLRWLEENLWKRNSQNAV